MTLPESNWVSYIDRLSAINKTAARKFVAFLNTHETTTAEGRKLTLDYAAALVQKYGESAAAVACEMYDAVAEASGVILPAAEPAAVASYGEVAKTVNGIMKQSDNPEYVSSGVERLVKQAGADTTLKNAVRDGAEFAWVPHGDTCSFCIMLASNGWQRASKKTIKGDHAEHIHANCDCSFAIRFDGKSKVGGYDPNKYREMYDNAEGDTWQEKLNSMRREEYAKNPEKIRVQKRKAYGKSSGLKNRDNNGIISKKLSDRFLDINNATDNTFSFAEIEKDLESTPEGKAVSKYIQDHGMNVTMDYSLDEDGALGDVYGKEITIFAANHRSIEEIADTLLHETCHAMFDWNGTQENEVNCRLMELFHRKGNVTDSDIRRVVAQVKKLYPELQEGDLYEFDK